MNLELKHISNIKSNTLQITGSKSETNRLLILQSLYPEIEIDNVSNSDDSQLMQSALASKDELVDIHHAGTAMRFLTAYFAVQKGRQTILTGSKRMQERPIKILVEGLKQLGCDISYEKEEGFPPIKIIGKDPISNRVSLAANVSSQYISALMLIASSLSDGLEIVLEGKVTSVPYIEMTLSLLKDVGVTGSFKNNVISIKPVKVVSPKLTVVESDWSSASYFYSIVALSTGSTITLGSYKQNSYQGDSALADIYKNLGVETTFENNKITLKNVSLSNESEVLELDLANSPDIAQTIAVTCFGLGKACYLKGLHTLKIKETDRLEALKTEIEKLGGVVTITEDSLRLAPATSIRSEIAIDTYHDHRMAMAFAPLALRTTLFINDADVVSKSYPDFWDDLKKLDFKVL
ncbi:3-phosphoshikimate 1-carboxyvinyltransferase [uncultured Aquimarina sp.]|uniref:3-phosphoshikimate 1-carboxyvinyltransferase n=1 Tax=uncultured Aquimarina sp. TaxID=575652 RepID=UPI002607BD48|nr:3-phosphoshikimate 1-carboxyvinyltransferase [uncultured Aquimarina sp.]